MGTVELRCATWNIHGAVGSDGVARPDRVAAVLRQLGTDLVALQEVDARRSQSDGGDPVEWLGSETGMAGVAGPTYEVGGGYFGNALLTRLPVEAVDHLDISVPGREPRGVLHVVLRAGGGPLQVLVTHFGLRARERARQAKALIELVRRQPEIPTIVAGDFNEWSPRSRTIARLDAELGAAPAVRSFPARLPLLRLDRIWVRPRSALRSIESRGGAAARAASDHLPVVATVTLAA